MYRMMMWLGGLTRGATTHARKDRGWFKVFQPVDDGSVLHMGNESSAPIVGVGSVVLEFTSGKTINLSNVMYARRLHKNLVSGSVLNKCGYRQVFESDKYILSKSGNKKYFVTFIDDASRFCYVYLLHSKDKALDKFKTYKTEIELQKNSSIKRLRTDRGGEYIDTSYFQSVGIIHGTTAPYTPYQNGVSERKNRVLKEMINSMLLYSGLSDGFLGEAMLTACYLLNRVPNKRNKVTPYELWFYAIAPNDFISVNTMIESMNAIFDDTQFSSIPRPKEIISTINDEMDSIMGNNTWVLADLPPGCKPLGCKWIFKKKMKVDGTIEKFNARLVIQGFRQRPGIDYFDTYVPVARISTIRLLISLKSIHNLAIHQMDVKTTFLNGDLNEEVYMKQPEGFIMPSNEHKQVDLTEEFLSSRFSMKDMGKADVILGIRIIRENKGISISQSHYIEKLEYSKVIGCLMYAMTSTRPDIAYAVEKLSRFTSNPSTHHWQAIRRVLKYLKKIMYYGLSYSGFPFILEGYSDASWITNVEDHSSTSGWIFLLGGGARSWASKKQTCITNSRMEFEFVAEFVALAAARKEAEWLRNLIHEIPLWPKPISPISIHCDSAATLAKAYSQMYNGKSRHLGVRHSMIRELIINGVISVEFVKSQHNLADHLTKGLARDLVHKSVIGMV
ncbi:UNVERIFIED_CONTAM: Retrovirus-related Pol polyprotein from transposon TNT 1-94 [Sesamum radiatum]|uniref:Retrovirus-related Pol polyprotein from transposon TNT 1-94 n=1 Tax=Sesamum radiatum TaxID=300843 RepID=A0AAW2QZK9_SESRA